MGSGIISAYYKFQLVQDKFGKYSLIPMFKYLNDESFNIIFESPDQCKVSVTGPCPEANDYICYSLKFKDYDQNDGMILLNTSAGLLPWGVGRAKSYNDCFIWRVSEDQVFEVVAFHGLCDQSYQLLANVQDGSGSAREQIDKTFALIESLEIEND